MTAEHTLSVWNGNGWTEIGRAEPGGVEFATPLSFDPPSPGEQPFASPQTWTCSFTVPLHPRAFAEIMRVIHAGHPLGRRRWSRCPLCNPRGCPGKLLINGHEYHRRQIARKKRRR